jgi:hypothetical protein
MPTFLAFGISLEFSARYWLWQWKFSWLCSVFPGEWKARHRRDPSPLKSLPTHDQLHISFDAMIQCRSVNLRNNPILRYFSTKIGKIYFRGLKHAAPQFILYGPVIDCSHSTYSRLSSPMSKIFLIYNVFSFTGLKVQKVWYIWMVTYYIRPQW